MLKICWKQAEPARRASLLLIALAIIGTIVLLLAPKPWQWKAPADGHMRIGDYVRVYSWWAGVVNCVLLAALGANARWWMRGAQGGLYHFPRPALPRWFLPLTILAMLLCAWFGAHRLRQSFWDDEVYAMRRAIHGQWKRNNDGSIRFRPVTWQETFWFFEKPQHQLHSVVSRIVLDTWRAVAKPQGLKFREDVVRIPSYLAGVFSVGAIALLLWRLGFPAAGVIAAFFLVVHPWHIRYASELRAYSFMLLVIPLCYVFLIEALESGHWRWWIAYGIGLLFLMYSNALHIYPALGAGLCGLAAVAIQWGDPRAKVQLARFTVVVVLAGMVFFQLMLPCVPQFADYLRNSAVHGNLDLRWLSSYLGLLFVGAPWSSTGRPASPYMEVYPQAISHPIVFAALAGSILVLLAIGTRKLLLRGPIPGLVALALLLPAPLAYAISKACGNYLFEWYLLFCLPGVISAIAVGLDSLRLNLARKIGTPVAVALIACFFAAYVSFTTPQRTWLLNRPIQQIRESAKITRPELDPFAKQNENILTASFLGPPDPYDANIIIFRSVEELSAIIARADNNDKALFVNFGFLTTAQMRFPSILNLLSDSSLFEKTAELQGFAPVNDRYVYRYKPKSAVGRDLVTQFEANPG